VRLENPLGHGGFFFGTSIEVVLGVADSLGRQKEPHALGGALNWLGRARSGKKESRAPCSTKRETSPLPPRLKRQPGLRTGITTIAYTAIAGTQTFSKGPRRKNRRNK
jgi:hypothetical protein